MRLLVTGVTGFVGRHALAFLRAEHPEVEVLGLARHAVADSACPCWAADVEDPAALDARLESARPDRVLHLAAQASPHDSFLDPRGTLRTNVEGTLNLLEAVRRRAPRARVLVVGSGEEYGVAGGGRRLAEDAPLRPLSPYAASKLAQSYLALQYHLAYGLDLVRTRTFNHTGPGRGADFAESSFARQIAEIEAGRLPPVIQVGNLDAVRDFCDVRDVVRAYWRLLEAGRAGEVYNVCSGAGVRIREVLERLLALSGARVTERVDPGRLRPSDIPGLVGDPSKLRRETGWEPKIPLDRTLRDLLEDWRARVATEAQVRP